MTQLGARRVFRLVNRIDNLVLDLGRADTPEQIAALAAEAEALAGELARTPAATPRQRLAIVHASEAVALCRDLLQGLAGTVH